MYLAGFGEAAKAFNQGENPVLLGIPKQQEPSNPVDEEGE